MLVVQEMKDDLVYVLMVFALLAIAVVNIIIAFQ